MTWTVHGNQGELALALSTNNTYISISRVCPTDKSGKENAPAKEHDRIYSSNCDHNHPRYKETSSPGTATGAQETPTSSDGRLLFKDIAIATWNHYKPNFPLATDSAAAASQKIRNILSQIVNLTCRDEPTLTEQTMRNMNEIIKQYRRASTPRDKCHNSNASLVSEVEAVLSRLSPDQKTRPRYSQVKEEVLVHAMRAASVIVVRFAIATNSTHSEQQSTKIARLAAQPGQN